MDKVNTATLISALEIEPLIWVQTVPAFFGYEYFTTSIFSRLMQRFSMSDEEWTPSEQRIREIFSDLKDQGVFESHDLDKDALEIKTRQVNGPMYSFNSHGELYKLASLIALKFIFERQVSMYDIFSRFRDSKRGNGDLEKWIMALKKLGNARHDDAGKIGPNNYMTMREIQKATGWTQAKVSKRMGTLRERGYVTIHHQLSEIGKFSAGIYGYLSQSSMLMEQHMLEYMLNNGIKEEDMVLRWNIINAMQSYYGWSQAGVEKKLRKLKRLDYYSVVHNGNHKEIRTTDKGRYIPTELIKPLEDITNGNYNRSREKIFDFYHNRPDPDGAFVKILRETMKAYENPNIHKS